MYLSPLQQQAYEKMKQWIADGRYIPGDKFPKESELASHFQMARNTLRPCLEQLSLEGVITRIKRKGTFVKKVEKSKKVIFLLPCPGFLDSQNPSAIRLRQMLRGVTMAALEANMPLETICLTTDNQSNHLDWSQLSRISPDDLVFCPTTWSGEDLFPYLKKVGCPVAVVTGTMRDLKMLEANQAKWQSFYRRVDKGVEEGILKLYAEGYRKIALVSPFIDEFRHPALIAYEKMTKELGLSYHHWRVWPLDQGPSQVAELYLEHPFDALITNFTFEDGSYPINLTDYLGIPQQIRLFCLNQLPEWLLSHNNLIWMEFAYDKIGETAVKKLIENSTQQKTHKFDAIIQVSQNIPVKNQVLTLEAIGV